MRYLNGNILCVEGSEFIRTEKNPHGWIPENTYKSLQKRGQIVKHNRGGNGNTTLIEFEGLPEVYKEIVRTKLGGCPYEYMAKKPIRDLIKPDIEAIKFFDKFEFNNGKPLSGESRKLYSNDAAILKAFDLLLKDKRELKRLLNISLSQFWAASGELVKDVSKQYPNTLPTSERRLKPRYNSYVNDGYVSLIDGREFNEANNKKRDGNMERLLMSLYIKFNKPYSKEVHEYYERFMAGEIVIYDTETGELFNREDYYKDGEPIALSETTVWRCINKPINRAVADKMRTGALEFSSKHRPHMNRHSGVYALSKITMDDISLPYKMHDGKRVWSYQVWDVTSEAVIGRSFGKSNDEGSGKNRGLFMQAITDMFRNVVTNGWGVPAQIEVEQHISNTFSEDLLKEGYVFPFVRFCRGGNPQEKRAEHMINRKKYGLQRQRAGFQARPFARTEANRMNLDADKVRYSFDEIVANEIADIAAWNNALHPKQDKYPGLTRWQVLEQNINPQLSQPDLSFMSLYIGQSTVTSIQRSQYVQVKHNKYALPSPAVLNELKTLQVTAHYIPETDGTIKEVHLYQDEQFVCTCAMLTAYNEAQAERTDADVAIMQRQFAYRTQFDTNIKERVNKLAKVQISDSLPIDNTPKKVIKKAKNTPLIVTNQPAVKMDWRKKAMEDL